MAGCLSETPTHSLSLPPQLYELDGDPKRKEFLDDLFSFMQKRGEHCTVGTCGGGMGGAASGNLWRWGHPIHPLQKGLREARLCCVWSQRGDPGLLGDPGLWGDMVYGVLEGLTSGGAGGLPTAQLLPLGGTELQITAILAQPPHGLGTTMGWDARGLIWLGVIVGKLRKGCPQSALDHMVGGSSPLWVPPGEKGEVPPLTVRREVGWGAGMGPVCPPQQEGVGQEGEGARPLTLSGLGPALPEGSINTGLTGEGASVQPLSEECSPPP